MQKQTKEKRENKDFGVIFKETLKPLSCVMCKSDLFISMIMNFNFNPRMENEPRGVTLYKVSCGRCKDETNHFSTGEHIAAQSWTKYQSNKLGNNAERK